jgi:mannosyltransferase
MRPMSEVIPPLAGRLRTAAVAGVVVVVAAGVVLRFWTRSGLWLDEALTIDIARLPLHQIPSALRHDGAPPLYYYLLHFWMKVFGQSNVAVRSLSGVLGVVTLPVAYLCGKRFGGRAVGWILVALLASAPFAVFYATESRMYGLVILLTGCGYLALERAVVAPTRGNLAAVAVVTAALLYTQYWSLYLVGIVGLWLLANIIRSRRAARRGVADERPAPWPALIALAVGCLLFVPWAPTFLYQSKHTGTPWAAPPNFAAVINAVTGFTDNQASNTQAVTNEGRLMAVIYFALMALALFGVARTERIVELDLHTRPRARGTTFVVVGTLFAAIAGGILTSSAFSSRYAAIVFLPLLMVVALGTATLLSPRIRLVLVALTLAAGLFASFQNITTQRTQAPKVAAVLNVQAQPGDVIAFCPDQLGPDVYRVVAHQGRYYMRTFPRDIAPQIVDWVDYAKAVKHGHPGLFVDSLIAHAGSTHRIWLVWQPGYQLYETKCEEVATDLINAPGYGARNWVVNNGAKYYEPMNLTEFAPKGQ